MTTQAQVVLPPVTSAELRMLETIDCGGGGTAGALGEALYRKPPRLAGRPAARVLRCLYSKGLVCFFPEDDGKTLWFLTARGSLLVYRSGCQL